MFSSVVRAVFAKADDSEFYRLSCQPFLRHSIEHGRPVGLKTLYLNHKNLLSRAAARH